MRDLEEASRHWQHFLTYTTLSELKTAVRGTDSKTNPAFGSRSLCWKTFLLFEDSPREEWCRRISDARSAYASVRNHLLKALEHPEEIGSAFDPLSDGTESPWDALRQDETLRAEILQDVDRCMPENVYFRQPGTQKMLLDILFVFCKLNPDISYRQGMHELVAPVLWVVERDAITKKPDGESTKDGRLLLEICDSDYIEHDTFTLFGIVMQGAKSFYEQAAHSAPSKLSTDPARPAAALENPIITRIHRIFNEYLPHVDPKLSQHLREIDLIPQVFLMKWIRLLFGREFPFDNVLQMWDVMFAEDPTLEVVDLVCLVMIIRLHWDLIESDYNTALTLLLRYPAPSDSLPLQALVLDAIYLQKHLHQAGASHVIEKHSGKPLPPLEANDETSLPEPATPAQSTFGSRLQAVALSPRSISRQPSNFDRVFQDAAKGLFKRGEQWGINKAVRDAIVEVQKGVREIQNTPTPTRPRISSARSASRQSGPEMAAKLTALEQRSTALAKMLKGATDELWRYHEEAVAGKGGEKETLEALSLAIARVQFTQVYLEDSTVPLPVDDDDAAAAAAATEHDSTEADRGEENPTAADEKTEDRPPTSSSTVPPPPPSKSRPKKQPSISSSTDLEKRKPSKSDIPTDFQTPRPSLTQSSFSWMLGQDSSPSSSFVQAHSLPPSAARRRSKGFLFGNGDDDHVSADGDAGNHGGGGGGIGGGKMGVNKLRKKRQESVGEVLFEQETEEWDLGKLEEEAKEAKEQREKGKAGTLGNNGQRVV